MLDIVNDGYRDKFLNGITGYCSFQKKAIYFHIELSYPRMSSANTSFGQIHCSSSHYQSDFTA